jgi:hypothetical protein
MDFTKEELFEIEKMADKAAGYCVAAHADFVVKTWPTAEKQAKSNLRELCEKVDKETLYYWDMMRTISAKCQVMRK